MYEEFHFLLLFSIHPIMGLCYIRWGLTQVLVGFSNRLSMDERIYVDSMYVFSVVFLNTYIDSGYFSIMLVGCT